jgi:hypothetical protein
VAGSGGGQEAPGTATHRWVVSMTATWRLVRGHGPWLRMPHPGRSGSGRVIKSRDGGEPWRQAQASVRTWGRRRLAWGTGQGGQGRNSDKPLVLLHVGGQWLADEVDQTDLACPACRPGARLAADLVWEVAKHLRRPEGLGWHVAVRLVAASDLATPPRRMDSPGGRILRANELSARHRRLGDLG